MLPSNLIQDRKIEPAYATTYRSVVAPQNATTASLGSKITINLPPEDSAVLNSANSGLRFTATYTASGAGATMRLDSIGAHAFIQRLVVKHGSNQWESTDFYGVAVKQLFEMNVPLQTNANKHNILLGTRGDFALDCSLNITSSPSVRQINSGDLIFSNTAGGGTVTKTYFIPLLSVMNLLCGKNYFPLWACQNAPITFEITLTDSIYKVGVCNAQHTVTFSDIAYIADLVRLSPSAMQMVRQANASSEDGSADCVMPFTGLDNYTYTSGTIGANSKITMQIPAKFSSLKQVIVCQRATALVGVLGYFPYSSVVDGVSEYVFKVGNQQVPSTPINTLVETFCEVAKCFGSIGDHYYSPNVDWQSYSLNASSIAPPIGATEFYQQITSGAYMIGIDLESYPSTERNKLWAGMNTNTADLWLNITYGGTVPHTQVTLDAFAYSDKKLIMKNGIGYIAF